MPVNAPFVETERDENEKTIEQKKLKGTKMNGMVLDDSRVIYMMDNSGSDVRARLNQEGRHERRQSYFNKTNGASDEAM